MGFFSTRNSDGASGKAESCNTISGKDWKDIQDRALKANPEQRDTFSKESTRRRIQASDNYRKRGQN